MGNRFIFLYCLNTISATIGRFPTPSARLSMLVCMLNWHKSLENCNNEKEIKSRNRSNLQLRPGVHEKGNDKNFEQPYL